MGKSVVGCGSVGGNWATASSTYYLSIGMGAILAANTPGNEAYRQHAMGHAGTFSMLSVEVNTNGRSTASTVRFRKNTANGNQSVSITASTTGQFQDAVNTDAVVVSDLVDLSLSTSTGSGGFILGGSCMMQFETAGSAVSMLYSSSSSDSLPVINVASVTGNVTIMGDISRSNSVQASHRVIPPVGGTLSNLSIYVVSNARSTTTTFGSEIAGSLGNLAISVGSTATGLFTDTTHSDTFSASNTLAIQYTTSTGTGSLVLSRAGMEAEWATTTVLYGNMDPGGQTAALGDTYLRPIGGTVSNATEALQQGKNPFAGTANVLSCRWGGTTNTRTITFRVNGADTALTVSIAGGVSGTVTDSSHTVTLAAGDLLSFKQNVTVGSSAAPEFTFLGLAGDSTFVPKIMIC